MKKPLCRQRLFHFLCRNEATRTPDPYVPNVVRYQLRYIPIPYLWWCHQESNRGHKDFQSFALPTELWHLSWFAGAKIRSFFDTAMLSGEKCIKKSFPVRESSFSWGGNLLFGPWEKGDCRYVSVHQSMFGLMLCHWSMGGSTPMAITSSRKAHKCS